MEDDKAETRLGDIDKMTFELMANKSQYQRYLSKTDPLKHKEHQDYLQKIRKYKDRILKMMTDFTEDPDKQVTIEVNESVASYMKTMIKFFEIEDLEKEGAYHSSNTNDEPDETLFGEIDNSVVDETPNVSLTRCKTTSYWGIPVSRT